MFVSLRKSLVGNASCLMLWYFVCICVCGHEYTLLQHVIGCGCICMHCYLGQTVFTPNMCEHLRATVYKLYENQFSIVNIKRWNVYANVISKLMGFDVNKYWLKTSAWCVRSLHSSGKVALQHPKSNQERGALFCQVRIKRTRIVEKNSLSLSFHTNSESD